MTEAPAEEEAKAERCGCAHKKYIGERSYRHAWYVIQIQIYFYYIFIFTYLFLVKYALSTLYRYLNDFCVVNFGGSIYPACLRKGCIALGIQDLP